MLVSVFLALFIPCAGMSAVFVVYICLLCYSASSDNTNTNNQDFQTSVKPNREKGLSASDLERLPTVTGKDLVLGTDCAVCLDNIEGEQLARIVPGCNHGFHLECADAWLSKNSSCPVCRAKIGPEILNPPETDSCPV